jgi:hypothetical protein
MEQIYSHFKLGFGIVIGTQTVTSKRSPEPPVAFRVAGGVKIYPLTDTKMSLYRVIHFFLSIKALQAGGQEKFKIILKI